MCPHCEDVAFFSFRFCNVLSVFCVACCMLHDVCVCRMLHNVCVSSVTQVHRKYTGDDFDEDLRTVLRRSGCKNEKIAFIMDESNVLDSGFLERMNTLLANGEVSFGFLPDWSVFPSWFQV